MLVINVAWTTAMDQAIKKMATKASSKNNIKPSSPTLKSGIGVDLVSLINPDKSNVTNYLCIYTSSEYIRTIQSILNSIDMRTNHNLKN